jgi:DNA processing protein
MSGQPALPLHVSEAMPAPALVAEPDARRSVVALLSPTPVQIDELVRQSGLPAAQVAAVLLDLELEGALARHAGGRVALG